MLMVSDANTFQGISPVNRVALGPDRPWRKCAFHSLVTWLRLVRRSIFFKFDEDSEKVK